MSWIHLDDEVDLIEFGLRNEGVQGPLNATAPLPVTNLVFTRALGEVLKRPTLFPLPSFVLRLALGEMAGPLLLKGQRVLPQKAIEEGYKFRFPKLHEALENLLG
jgi:NAD dependent epimerase/dehydratase family enzyme